MLAGCLAFLSVAATTQGYAASDAAARPIELGAPLLRNFSQAEYGTGTQNWAITQDVRGVMYMGNVDDGVLEYDGIRWRRIPTDNRTTIRSLAAAPDGRVYVGANGELGYLEPDADGRSHYVSLLERLPEAERDFADVWRTYVTPQGIYFSTFKQLIRISDHGTRVWRAQSNFHLAFQVGDAMYIREVGRGLLQLVDDELVLVPGGELFANEKIYVMLPWSHAAHGGERSILIGTRTQGWFLFDGQRVLPWKTEADAMVHASQLYGAIWLADGSLAVATLQGGVFLLDTQGRLLGHIDRSIGLADDTVYDLFQDRQGGLWLALDRGLARVDVSAPLSHFGQRAGLEGSIITMQRHAGELYVGTTQGLYRLLSKPQEPACFVPIREIQGQTWAFIDWGDALLVAGVQGVFELRAGKAQLIRPSQQTNFTMMRSRTAPERVFIGMHDGLASIRRDNGKWVDEGAVAHVSDEVRTIFEQPDGELWLGTLATGVVKVRFPDGRPGGAEPQLARFGREQGLPRSPHYVYAVDGAPVFATTQGIYRFEERSKTFAPDPRFAGLFPGEARQVFPLVQDLRGRVWMYSTDDSRSIREAGAAVSDGRGGYRWDPRPLRQAAGTAIVTVYAENDALWFGGDDGIYRHDPALPVDYERSFAALIREVADRQGRLIFGGAGPRPVPRLPFVTNALRFEFAAPSFGNRPNTFQVFLEGVDQDWSTWSAEAYRDYTNLHEGVYRFRVRAMNAFGTVSEEDVYEFQILPPWYRTWLAYLCYLVATAALLAGISRWRSATLRARNAELAQLVAMRTEELSGANRSLKEANAALAEQSVTDALTGLKNRRYLVEHISADVAGIRRSYEERIRHPDTPYSANSDMLLIVVDIDHFKQVNDHYGHAAGDRVLQQFARILQSVCRETDTAVRWGGEEFLIVARGADRECGPVLAERIRALMATHIFQLEEGKTLRRTCSVGFVSYPVLPFDPARFSWEQAVELADQCLYQAKRSGRNVWVGAQATAKTPPTDALENGIDLMALAENGHLQLCHMQPSGRRVSNG